jgi:hypothetical protein
MSAMSHRNFGQILRNQENEGQVRKKHEEIYFLRLTDQKSSILSHSNFHHCFV